MVRQLRGRKGFRDGPGNLKLEARRTKQYQYVWGPVRGWQDAWPLGRAPDRRHFEVRAPLGQRHSAW